MSYNRGCPEYPTQMGVIIDTGGPKYPIPMGVIIEGVLNILNRWELL